MTKRYRSTMLLVTQESSYITADVIADDRRVTDRLTCASCRTVCGQYNPLRPDVSDRVEESLAEGLGRRPA